MMQGGLLAVKGRRAYDVPVTEHISAALIRDIQRRSSV